MIEPETVTFQPLSNEEVGALRGHSRSDRSFDARLGRAVRLGFFAALRPRGLDPEASLGLDLAAREALVLLMGVPAETSGQVHRRRSLLLAHRRDPACDPALAALLDATLAADGKAMRNLSPFRRGEGQP